MQVNLRSSDGSDRWGFGVPIASLEGLPASAQSGVATDVRFVLTREAGVFRFQGSFDNGRGTGSYSFTAAAPFVSGMAARGYRTLSTDELVRLAVIDVTQAYTQSLADAGYKSLTIDDLVRMRIHRVTAEMIRDLDTLGYPGSRRRRPDSHADPRRDAGVRSNDAGRGLHRAFG